MPTIVEEAVERKPDGRVNFPVASKVEVAVAPNDARFDDKKVDEALALNFCRPVYVLAPAVKYVASKVQADPLQVKSPKSDEFNSETVMSVPREAVREFPERARPVPVKSVM